MEPPPCQGGSEPKASGGLVFWSVNFPAARTLRGDAGSAPCPLPAEPQTAFASPASGSDAGRAQALVRVSSGSPGKIHAAETSCFVHRGLLLLTRPPCHSGRRSVA